jgi:hypothetical protein
MTGKSTGEAERFPCPDCGHRRTVARCWECDVGEAAADRTSPLELVGLAVTAAVLQPFVAAIATRAGEEVWPKIAGLVRRERRKEIDRRLDDVDLLELTSCDGRFVISMPKRLSAAAARDLQDVMGTLQNTVGRFRLTYEAETGSWNVIRVEDGPEGGPAAAQ